MTPLPAPLAYVFWHWKRSQVAVAEYEDRQRAFQAALAEEPPEGFLGGSTGRLTGAEWAAGGGEAYEDWYLVEDMAALERLNHAAVSRGRQVPHDEVAALAEAGTAGLYGLRSGEPATWATHDSWFAKPTGMSYAALDGTLQGLLDRTGAGLWSRKMTLGPTPEFCLRSATPIHLPAPLLARTYSLHPVWRVRH